MLQLLGQNKENNSNWLIVKLEEDSLRIKNFITYQFKMNKFEKLFATN